MRKVVGGILVGVSLFLGPLRAQEPPARRPDRFQTGRQPTDPLDTLDFDAKQQAIARLLDKQWPVLTQLESRMEAYATGLAALDSLLSYPAHAEAYQDSALRVLQRVSSFLREVEHEVRFLHYEWLPLQQDLLSLHTRYGELWVSGTANERLQQLILSYRTFYQGLQELLHRREYLYNETEFLLNAKLD